MAMQSESPGHGLSEVTGGAGVDSALARARRIVRRTQTIFGLLCAVCACAAVILGLLCALLEVASRYNIGRGIPLALPDEGARGMLAWLAFLGPVIVLRDSGHLRFQALESWLPTKAVVLRDVVIDILVLLVVCYVANLGFATFKAGLNAELSSISAPQAIFSGSIFFGFTAQAIYIALDLCSRAMNYALPGRTPAVDEPSVQPGEGSL